MPKQRGEWEARYAEVGARPMPPASDFLLAHLTALPRGRALDLACGEGRHALLLARHGFVVDAIDFARPGLERLAAVARRDRLPVRAVQADLEHYPLPRDRYAVVVNIRYLQRSLFAPMQAAVQRGGVVVFETFLRDHEQIGHPRNPAFLLERGELAAAFAAFERLVHEEGRCETETGPAFLARMLARRP